jgi:release factor glutamine methyltransferase
MILRQVLMQGARALREAAIDGPERDARLLLAHVVGMHASRMSLEPDLPISADQLAQFHKLLARRAANEPVSRILGTRQFWGRDFAISPDVLDPRGDTETLIAAALQGPTPNRLIDLGTGSGIIAITLLAEWPAAQGVASDISAACLAMTHLNAETHEVGTRITCVESDWFAQITGQFDLILSNPPYISEQEMTELAPDVARYDPHLALTPGVDGLGPYGILAKGARDHLLPKGRLLTEIGWKQGDAVAEIFAQAGLIDISILQDLDGRDRVISAYQPG